MYYFAQCKILVVTQPIELPDFPIQFVNTSRCADTKASVNSNILFSYILYFHLLSYLILHYIILYYIILYYIISYYIIYYVSSELTHYPWYIRQYSLQSSRIKMLFLQYVFHLTDIQKLKRVYGWISAKWKEILSRMIGAKESKMFLFHFVWANVHVLKIFDHG